MFKLKFNKSCNYGKHNGTPVCVCVQDSHTHTISVLCQNVVQVLGIWESVTTSYQRQAVNCVSLLGFQRRGMEKRSNFSVVNDQLTLKLVVVTGFFSFQFELMQLSSPYVKIHNKTHSWRVKLYIIFNKVDALLKLFQLVASCAVFLGRWTLLLHHIFPAKASIGDIVHIVGSSFHTSEG